MWGRRRRRKKDKKNRKNRKKKKKKRWCLYVVMHRILSVWK